MNRSRRIIKGLQNPWLYPALLAWVFVGMPLLVVSTVLGSTAKFIDEGPIAFLMHTVTRRCLAWNKKNLGVPR